MEVSYRLRVVCNEREQGVIRTILLRHVNSHPKMVLQGVTTQDGETPDRVTVAVDIFSTDATTGRWKNWWRG